MTSWVLDASAILAVIWNEPGSDMVRAAVRDGAALSSVNIAEVITKLAERGLSEPAIHLVLAQVNFEAFPFDLDMAYRTGLLRPLTRHAGLSLGDRACLALGEVLGVPVLTADTSWRTVEVGVTVHVIG